MLEYQHVSLMKQNSIQIEMKMHDITELNIFLLEFSKSLGWISFRLFSLQLSRIFVWITISSLTPVLSWLTSLPFLFLFRSSPPQFVECSKWRGAEDVVFFDGNHHLHFNQHQSIVFSVELSDRRCDLLTSTFETYFWRSNATWWSTFSHLLITIRVLENVLNWQVVS
jgi:hypothetical protein